MLPLTTTQVAAETSIPASLVAIVVALAQVLDNPLVVARDPSAAHRLVEVLDSSGCTRGLLGGVSLRQSGR
jgi:hypothetical protein